MEGGTEHAQYTQLNRFSPGIRLVHVNDEVETVDLIADGQFERGVDVAVLLVTTHVETGLGIPAVDQPVDEPWIAMEVEDHRLVGCEQAVEVRIAQTVWVFGGRCERKQFHHIHVTHLQCRDLLSEKFDRRQTFLGGDVTR